MVTHRGRQRTRAIMIQKLLNHTAVHRADFRARPVQPNKEVPNRSQITSDAVLAKARTLQILGKLSNASQNSPCSYALATIVDR